ncbi:MAG: NAD-dependent epimerase [Deltaproteobacteria bacterium]|nr:NAD-dependent epimerase [Deltaproteobacteria bacterium]
MNRKFNKIMITGAAGFIGFHLAKKLLQEKFNVTGIDNIDDYYDTRLKQDRLNLLLSEKNFNFKKINIANNLQITEAFKQDSYDAVINLAAQAGVRYSLTNPHSYVNSNLVGFANILEGCRHYGVQHLVFASSSSVYGANTKMPFSVNHNTDHPVSLYAATKKANELMAHSYSHLYKLPCTGLRFFTVYGPWGRPDMALFLFTKAILEKKPIKVFNYGKMQRDFTYIDDITEGIVRVMKKIPEKNKEWNSDAPDSSSSFAPYRLYNIGNNNPVTLLEFIETIEKSIGIKAKKEFIEIQDGDVPATYANIDSLIKETGFAPKTLLKEGIKNFITWYKAYYKI